jgi:hypothetical protein
MQRTIDPTLRTLRLDLVNDTYKQSTGVGVDGIINRSRQLVKVQASGSFITLTYFDSHSLKYIIKTIENKDPVTGEPKPERLGPVTWNAYKVRSFRGESDFLQLAKEKKDKVVLVEQPPSDVDWKSDVRFFGIRDALLGAIPYNSRS